MIASDALRQRNDIRQLDYLSEPPPPGTEGGIAITNPPFNGSRLGDPFIRRTLDLLDDGHLAAAVLLQRADSGGTAGHAAWFNRTAAEVTCCWRAVWIPGSKVGPRWWFVWHVWLAGHNGPPVTTRLRRRELAALTAHS